MATQIVPNSSTNRKCGPPTSRLTTSAMMPRSAAIAVVLPIRSRATLACNSHGAEWRRAFAGNAMACGTPDARADLLHHGHDRVAQQHEPAEREAEQRPCLRIGCD